MQITFKGEKVTLKGTRLKKGDPFPSFTLVKNDLSVATEKDFSGVRVFLTIPSLDTGVCDLEIRNFNQKASELPDVSICAVSLDLPFAQARWCGAKGVYAVTTLSDYRDRSFGMATGTLIEGINLLTRAAFVVNESNVVQYAEYVPEVANHPDYEKVYRAVSSLLQRKEGK